MFSKTIFGICLWLITQSVSAHAMGSSFLHLSEISPSVFSQNWVPAKEFQYLSQTVTPSYPSHCQQQASVIHCGERGLTGTITLDNLPLHADIVVRIEWLSGNQHTEIVAKNSNSITLTAASHATNSTIQIITTYTLIGIEHILMGIDHLLFVIGLILLVGFNKQLVWTITAFTLAHSLTLALSVLDIVSISQTPVEIIIALSIVLVAVEVLDKRITLARRRPWLVAFVFGLVHGLGFAGALREVGLPGYELPLSLFTFNLGVEFGQLAVIAVAYVFTKLIAHISQPRFKPQAAVIFITYVIGSLGAYWAVSRSVDLFRII